MRGLANEGTLQTGGPMATSDVPRSVDAGRWMVRSGTYVFVWKRQADGTRKVVVDKP